MELAYMVAGGREAYMEHPFLTHHYCPVVSPLSMDVLSTENVMYFAGQKVCLSIRPSCPMPV
jgi:trimethylamine---corrinoid protein Co-methyltransferase